MDSNSLVRPYFSFTLAFESLAPTITETAITTTSITSKLENVFKKGIKRDPAIFSVLKEDNQ